MSQKPETKFKEDALETLKKEFGADCYVIKTQEVGRRGVLDLIICLRGHYVSIELKKPGEEPDPLQQVNIGKVRKAGGIAYSSEPDQWPMIIELLRRLR